MSLIESTLSSRTAILRLNRPDKRNAISRRLIAELHAAFSQAISDPDVRVIVLTGNGPAFCAGMDLEELQASLTLTKETLWKDADDLGKLFDLIYTSPKPTIAAVNGAAVAGGAGLMTVCDLAISVPAAKFGYPEVRRGLVAALVLPHLLRHVGERAARHLLLTGELIDANEALRIDLVNQVVPAESLMAMAMKTAASLIEGGPEALASTKRLLQAMSKQAVSIAELAGESATPRLGAECKAGLEAFFAKKPAPWA